MKLSEMYSAMGMKVKLKCEDLAGEFREGNLIQIEPTRDAFFVNPYGEGVPNTKVVLCSASPKNAEYLRELWESEQEGIFRCLFLISGVEGRFLEVQPYTFQSVTEFATPITIVVPDDWLIPEGQGKLKQDYVWNQLGMPALFCLHYKNKKKDNANVRFIGGKRCLVARYTDRGIVAEKIAYVRDKYERDRYDLPVDVYVATDVQFVPESESAVNADLSAALQKFTSSDSYFARWEAYDRLYQKELEKESEEFGEIKYSSFAARVETNGTTYEFMIDQSLDDSLKGKEVGASEKETVEEQLDEKAKPKKQIGVGQIKKTLEGKVVTFLAGEDHTDRIPTPGVLKLYTAGDHSIMRRRQVARERMMGHKAPIKSIVALIEAGVTKFSMNSWRGKNPITEEFRRNFKRAGDLNAEQIAALSLAMSTPDIALIQGPPGTGKTTVIKAIVERFREKFEAVERQRQSSNPEYVLQSPKILISSFQNDAVDNAISAPLPGDLPAYRKTAKRTSDKSGKQYQKALDSWYTGLTETIASSIESGVATEYTRTKRILDDEFLSYKNAGEPIEKAAALINHYLSFVDISYPEGIVTNAKALIAAATSASDEDDYEEPIVKHLKAQPLSPEDFAKDGEKPARRLAACIRVNDELSIEKDILRVIEAVGDGDFTEDTFKAYVEAVEELKKRFCKERGATDAQDKSAINECILQLSHVFSKHYLDTLSSMEGKKSLILADFLSRLEQDYEEIVKKYSMTTAATCQTCLDLHAEEDRVYDLVIIDEAARANPLDLFIPMSMGRKIIMVGDQKQLPHMLEPDVLKLLEDTFKDIPDMEKSLFERLFDMFSKGPIPRALALTQQFRMHPEICDFVSENFYDGVLKTADSVTKEMRASSPRINGGKALVFVNVPIRRGAETPGASKSRRAEAEVIEKDVRHILDVDPHATVGVITFYAAQERMIKDRLDKVLNDEEKNNVEVGTVDAFQGKEFDYVLLSCVRSNMPKAGKKPVVGFLAKPNRLCVAFSRAIRQLAVYGDAETLEQIPCFARLYEICADEKGGYYRED